MNQDIKTSINTILEIADFQMKNGEIPDDVRDAFRVIFESGSNLMDLLRGDKPIHRKIIDSRKKRTSVDAIAELKKQGLLGEMKKYIVRDAGKAVDVLERVYPLIYEVISPDGTVDDKTIDSYVVTVHGMKSALANIGEAEMSAVSQRLELAGKNYDFSVIIEETPAFITSLKMLIDEFGSSDEQVSSADVEFSENISSIRDKLLDIKSACESYNINIARDILKELKQDSRAKDIVDVLDELDVFLLHSAFEDAANAVAKLLK